MNHLVTGTAAGVFLLGMMTFFPPGAEGFEEKNLGVGFNLNRGNADTMFGSATFDGRRRREKTDFAFALRGAYGDKDGETTAERISAAANFNRDLSEYLYWALSGGYERDGVAHLDYRFDLGTGLGRRLVRTEQTDLTVDAGPAWVVQRYRRGREEDFLAFQVTQRLERRFPERGRLWQSLRWLPEVAEPGDFLAILEVGLEAPFTGQSSLRLVLQNSYNSDPAEGREENDFSLMSFIAWQF